MLTLVHPSTSLDDLSKPWARDQARTVRARLTQPEPERAALLERIRLLELENSILQRQVQLMSDLAIMD